MTIVRRHLRDWLPLATLFLLILASLLILQGGEVVTRALSPSEELLEIDAGVAAQATFDLAKSAWPEEVVNGGLVTFTVTVSNTGPTTETVDAIVDTLDAGLTFAGVLTSSDVLTSPQQVSNTLTWTGPFTVSAESALTLLYQVQTPPVENWTQFCNSVEISATEAVSPAGACVDVRPEQFATYLPVVGRNFRYAHLALFKSAAPAAVITDDGQEIVYTVDIQNTGDTTGQLTGAHDVLPAGFSFLGMAAGSDVTEPPSIAGQELTWSLATPIEIPAGGQKRIIYRVSHSVEEGEYTNSVTVSASRATVQREAAQATVTVEADTLLEESFESDTQISRWTPFLNYHRQAEGQWYWGVNDGYNGTGGLTMNRYAVPDKDGEDGLMMYLEPGAEEWTDYRVEAKVILRTDNHPQGLWVRGQWEPSDTRAQWVTGYYVVIGGSPAADTHYVRLLQLQTLTDCWGPPCPSSPEYIPGREINLYNFNNPHALEEVQGAGRLQRNQWHTVAVEVRGANIKIWLNGDLYIDFTDLKEPFMSGTVGFKSYKADTVSYDDLVVTPLD